MPDEAETASDAASSTLYVRHFVRPFTLAAAKALFSDHGEVTWFWMDAIKTHCFVTFATVAQAQAALSAVNGVQWPAVTGRVLAAELIAADKAALRAASGGMGKEALAPAEPATRRPSGQAAPTTPKAAVAAAVTTPTATPVPASAAPAASTPTASTPDVAAAHEAVVVDTPSAQVKSLDDLFKKTVTKPVLYYKPVDEAVAAARRVQRQGGSTDARGPARPRSRSRSRSPPRRR